jgi:hypothetical protein
MDSIEINSRFFYQFNYFLSWKIFINNFEFLVIINMFTSTKITNFVDIKGIRCFSYIVKNSFTSHTLFCAIILINFFKHLDFLLLIYKMSNFLNWFFIRLNKFIQITINFFKLFWLIVYIIILQTTLFRIKIAIKLSIFILIWIIIQILFIKSLDISCILCLHFFR